MSAEEPRQQYYAPQLSSSIPDGSKKILRAWRERRTNIFDSLDQGRAQAAKEDEIPPDNIFVPIQADDILPQIPIGNHHPCPRTGIEDNDLRTLHTNSFYAGAFLGGQQHPIWTHPYAIWWGRGMQDTDMVQTWGMNIVQADKGDYQYGPGDHPKVRRCWKAETLSDRTTRFSAVHISNLWFFPQPSLIQRPS